MLSIKYPQVLEESELLRLFREYRETRSTSIKARLIKHNLRLASYVGNKYKKDDDDVFQVACIGLTKAVETFDPDKKAKFNTYAIRCMTNEVFMYFRKDKDYGRIQVYLDKEIINPQDGSSTATHEIIPSDMNLEEDYMEKVLLETIIEVSDELILKKNKKHQEIIKLRQNGMSQVEIAKRFNLSQSYISRIEAKHYKELKVKVEAIFK
ncbi:sigma-70 family RNA polymerase sigma factor [Clostridium formicaceticum]|uniref:RNA polymerase sigma-E factor n=1 Tax=Clostridium formicaceticum TaxID=1497 RepID=A0AAC9RK10_9CLOT|nr:sigma-70 family RNA polymerase sigma factor [Clostridium formicaceticum]AOY76668.1 hypothetical protein BJL90_12810 [Clostridium formicaceticum]ARE87097.1 RNA polymerase sigma-E factor precursor [Clostridium formicaceticum]